jgi:hypothetical protein
MVSTWRMHGVILNLLLHAGILVLYKIAQILSHGRQG